MVILDGYLVIVPRITFNESQRDQLPRGKNCMVLKKALSYFPCNQGKNKSMYRYL